MLFRLSPTKTRHVGTRSFWAVKAVTAGTLGIAIVLGTGGVSAFASPDPSKPTAEPGSSPSSTFQVADPSPSSAPLVVESSPVADATPTPTIVQSETATPEPSQTPTAAPQDTPTAATQDPEPAPIDASVPSATNPGAYMGQGMSKQTRNRAVNAPLSMHELVDEVATAQADTRSTPAGVPGMDVSGWQADAATHSVSQVNWASQWSMGARFVYVKATEGNNFSDRSRTSHIKGARSSGMLTGAYHFALPNQSAAVSQANYFVANGGQWTGDGKTLPPLLDIENNPYGNSCYNMTPAAMVTWIRDFSNRVLSQTGRLPMIYTNYYWWQDCTGNSTAFTNQALHIAAYTNSSPWIPGGWSNYSMWQFSDAGPFAGDSNVWNGTLASLQKFAAGSGPVATGPSIPSPADLVAVDSAGALWNYPKAGSGKLGARKQIGKGWTGLRSLNVIDWDADGTLDILAQWTPGSLSVYRGLPKGGFASALTLSGSGWADKQLTVGYWLNSSNRPQVLAKAPDGTLRLWTTPSAGQIAGGNSIGQGWGKFNLTMVDFDGDGRQDLLAQDPAGSLFLYRSNGAGGFVSESRAKIGYGWAGFTSVTVSSDFTAAGSVGLITRNRSGALAYYPIPGNRTFGATLAVGSGWNGYQIAGGDTINLTPPPVAPAGPAVVRMDGKDRYEVSAAVSKYTFPVGTNTVYIASGAVYTDALSGSAAAGHTASPILLTAPGVLPDVITAELTRLKPQRIVILGGSGTVSNSVQTLLKRYAPTVRRMDGKDRYEVSAAVSRATFWVGTQTAYIASGAIYTDALSGSAAAAHQGSPILLTAPNVLPDVIRAELTRLRPQKIVILGGPGTVGNDVQTLLRNYAPTVTRLNGKDRYEVSAAVSKSAFSTGTKTAYIASGAVYTDALSGSAAAGHTDAPVLLTAPNVLPDVIRAELTRLKPQKIVILGGSGTVSKGVMKLLENYVP